MPLPKAGRYHFTTRCWDLHEEPDLCPTNDWSTVPGTRVCMVIVGACVSAHNKRFIGQFPWQRECEVVLSLLVWCNFTPRSREEFCAVKMSIGASGPFRVSLPSGSVCCAHVLIFDCIYNSITSHTRTCMLMWSAMQSSIFSFSYPQLLLTDKWNVTFKSLNNRMIKIKMMLTCASH